MSLIKLTIIILSYIQVINAFNIKSNKQLAEAQKEINVVFRKIKQPLDHFNKNDTRTFEMFYCERLDFWKPGGPIYFYIDGTPLLLGMPLALAKETNGALYGSGHRYADHSLPFDVFDKDNLVYLTSQQALADYANLLRHIKSSPQFKSSKVVVIGDSYGGSLATWMRLLHPDLVDVAYASSSPLLALKDFHEFYDIIGEDYKQYGDPGCFDRMEKWYNSIDELLRTSDGIAKFKKRWRVCNDTDMTKQANKALFFHRETSLIVAYAMFETPEVIFDVCKTLFKPTQVLEPPNSGKHSRLLKFDVWREDFQCNDFELDNYVKGMDFDPYFYLRCTEFGWFENTSTDKQPFTKNIVLDMFYQMCTKLYGSEFNEERIDRQVKQTNNLYGGLKPDVSKVLFVNGDMDPYKALSVLEDLSDEALAKVIHGQACNSELFQDPSPKDSKELKEARVFIKNVIKKWIGVK